MWVQIFAAWFPELYPKGGIMNLSDKMKIIANHHNRLNERKNSLITRIAQLTAYGCINAKEYWKDGRYLYLLYPMKDGVRKKKYIGNHPLRIEEARKKLENYQTRSELNMTLRSIETELRHIERVINNLVHDLSGSDLSARFACVSEDGYRTLSSRRRSCTQ